MPQKPTTESFLAECWFFLVQVVGHFFRKSSRAGSLGRVLNIERCDDLDLQTAVYEFTFLRFWTNRAENMGLSLRRTERVCAISLFGVLPKSAVSRFLAKVLLGVHAGPVVGASWLPAGALDKVPLKCVYIYILALPMYTYIYI